MVAEVCTQPPTDEGQRRSCDFRRRENILCAIKPSDQAKQRSGLHKAIPKQ